MGGLGCWTPPPPQVAHRSVWPGHSSDFGLVLGRWADCRGGGSRGGELKPRGHLNGRPKKLACWEYCTPTLSPPDLGGSLSPPQLSVRRAPPPPADHNPIGDEGVELLGDGLKWARAASPWPVPISLPLPLCRGWHRWGASLFVQQALIQPFELPWLS